MLSLAPQSVMHKRTSLGTTGHHIFGTNVAENEKGENIFNQKVFSFSISSETSHYRL